MSRLGLRLTPHGRLSVGDQDNGPDIDAAASIRRTDAFARGTGYGLVWLGAAEVGQALPPLFVWWRDFAALYVGSLCQHASGMEAEGPRKLPSVPAPTAAELSSLVLTAPIMAGAEYLTQDVLLVLWDEMERAFAASLAAAKVGLQAFLTSLNRAWNLVGRVHFNLAENRRDPDQPFAFMATYTTRLSAQAKAQHVPLGQALREYAGTANRDKLLSLLLRGQWVEVDRARLQRTMEQFRAAEELAARDGLTFAEAMRMLAGAGLIRDDPAATDTDWARVNAGPWLEQTLKELRAPDGDGADPGPALVGTLRPYQKTGTRWMNLLAGLGLCACLADDMGLGKTIQVLSLLLVEQARCARPRPSLLVVPASLLANWETEIKKFAPGLKAVIVHPS